MSAAINCPTCGKFCKDSYDTAHGTQNGTLYTWGGTCKTCGEWSDSS